MLYLLLVSLAWAFSFGLIKGILTDLNPIFVSCARLLIAMIVFLPLLKLKGLRKADGVRLFLIGMVQFGLMYIAYIYSFQYLKAYEVALFTIFTPLFVTIYYNLLKKSFSWLVMLTTILAVIGTGVISQTQIERNDFWLGFAIVQVSNVCYAVGQVHYREVMSQYPGLKDQNVFGLLYIGAFSITALSTLAFADLGAIRLSTLQTGTLIYMGAVASGLCFFLWNLGARRVNIGTLAIFNDLKVPLSITVSLLVFQEQTNVSNLLIGGSIVVAALIVNELGVRRQKPPEKRVFEANS